MGHHVTVVGSSFSHSRQQQPKTQGRATLERLDGIRYLWLWGPQYAAKGTLGRVLSMFIFVVQLLLPNKILGEKYDVVVASSPPPFIIYPAFWRARQKDAKLIYDMRDLWPLTLTIIGNYSSAHPFVWLMQKAENFACRNVDVVTAAPKNCEAYLKGKGLLAGKFIFIGNGLLSPELSSSCTEIDKGLHVRLKEIREQADTIVGYAGALGVANAMDVLVKAASHTDQSVHYIIVGDGPKLKTLKAECQKYDLCQRFHFLGQVKPDDVQQVLSYVDILYAGLLSKPLYQYGASLTKLNDYMIAGKPIIYAANDPGNAVEQSGCGIVCEAEDHNEVAQAILKMSLWPEKQKNEHGSLGKTWVLQHNTLNAQMLSLLKFLGR
jgi:glycosyltransferase involved in cell wall biosynthesis